MVSQLAAKQTSKNRGRPPRCSVPEESKETQTMIKRTLLVALLAVGGCLAAASTADAGYFVRRVAPVRHVAARAVLPPYPVARAVVPGPVYRPWVGYGPAYYAPAPVVYGPGIGVVVY